MFASAGGVNRRDLGVEGARGEVRAGGRPLLCPGDIAGQGTCADSPHTAADDGDGSEKQERLSFRGRGHGATLVIVRAGAVTRAMPTSSR